MYFIFSLKTTLIPGYINIDIFIIRRFIIGIDIKYYEKQDALISWDVIFNMKHKIFKKKDIYLIKDVVKQIN